MPQGKLLVGLECIRPVMEKRYVIIVRLENLPVEEEAYARYAWQVVSILIHPHAVYALLEIIVL